MDKYTQSPCNNCPTDRKNSCNGQMCSTFKKWAKCRWIEIRKVFGKLVEKDGEGK